ncbi:MAG: putative secreted protein [Frankiales bacterium]|nr:putative secreted protein [Frankiales bacterium]
MGRLSDELRDPWGPLLGIIAGGVAGIGLSLGAPVAVGVGAVVYGVKVAVGALTGGDRPPELPPPARPRYGTPAFDFLKRAEGATKSLEDMARHAGSTSATDVAVKHAAEEARGILADMQRLGGQSAAVMAAMQRVDGPELDQEASRLQAAASAAPGDASAQASFQASRDRLAVRDRLQQAGQALDGRLQASALGLEGLVARVAELSATANAVGQVDPTPQDLQQLTTELDGLRMGLADVEQVARKALGAAG